ncbi:MAG: MIP/aquaporin family protein [Gemmatimonadales bacterium]
MRGPRLAAEAIGTFALVFIGAGAAAVNAWSNGAVSLTGIALAFGGIILVAVYALGHISGAHLNPAVTVGFWIARRFPGREVAPYVAAQIVGATAGGFAVRAAVGSFAVFTTTRPAIAVGAALAVEVVLSFFLMLVIMAVATDARVSGEVAGLAVGFIVMVDALMGGPLTGASMNPARSFGPALATGQWASHWIYWVGPLAGMAIAVPTYEYLRRGFSHDHRVTTAPS